MADVVADAIRVTRDAELVAVVGRTREGAGEFADRHGVAGAHDELSGALGGDVDAVYVGSPNALHARHAAEAIRARKHVLCDKPLAMDVASAEELVASAVACGVTLSVNLQSRQHPAVDAIRHWLNDGDVGRVVAVRASISFGTEELVGWRAEAELAGTGALYNLGIHAIDTVLAVLVKPPLAVSCELRPAGAALDRTALITIEFDGGALASVLASQELGDDDVRIEILGTDGRISWDGWLAPYRKGPLVLRRSDGSEVRAQAECPDAYTRVVRDFTDAVLSGRPPTLSPEAALETVRVVEGARESARLGLPTAM
jgi:predicted dehydrogenase